MKKINLNITTIALIVVGACFTVSCNDKRSANTFDYGTQNDSAYYYFNEGWEQILDNGQWTLSEASYRKALTFDPDFLIGRSLVGRISTNINERIQIEQELQREKTKAEPYERLLLDIYVSSISIINNRDQGIEVKPEVLKTFYDLYENNLRTFLEKYPNETYVKAEYIEIIHAKYGPKAALDSLKTVATKQQRNIPFLIGYSALMEAELGNLNRALSNAMKLQNRFNDSTMPQPHVVFAQVYNEMDSLELAKSYIDRAITLDSNHVIAQRLKKSIDQALSKNTN